MLASVSHNLLFPFFDCNPWMVNFALVSQSFKLFEWSMTGQPVNNSPPYLSLVIYCIKHQLETSLLYKAWWWSIFMFHHCNSALLSRSILLSQEWRSWRWEVEMDHRLSSVSSWEAPCRTAQGTVSWHFWASLDSHMTFLSKFRQYYDIFEQI